MRCPYSRGSTKTPTRSDQAFMMVVYITNTDSPIYNLSLPNPIYGSFKKGDEIKHYAVYLLNHTEEE